MTLVVLFQLVEALAVTAAVVVGLVQLREFRLARERTSALELLHSFQTPEFAKALVLVYGIPEGLSKNELVRQLGEDFHLVYAMTLTWESLGVLVFRGEVGLELVADFFSGPIILSWAKLRNYYLEDRERLSRETVGEWFEWLRDRLVESESKIPPQPAHVEHRNWRTPRRPRLRP